MKDIIKFSLLTIIFALLTSCDKDQTGARFVDGDKGVSFDNAKYKVEIETNVTYIDFHVSRVSAVSAATISITHTSTYHGIITIPQTVNFAKGEYETTLRISIDPGKMDPFGQYVFDLKLEDIASLGGINETNVTVNLIAPWIENIGYSTLTSDFYGYTKDLIVTDSLKIGTNIYYRLNNCYYGLEPEIEAGYHIIFMVDENDNVSVPFAEQNIGETYYFPDGYLYFRLESAVKAGREITFTVTFALSEAEEQYYWEFPGYTEVVTLP
ncbi:MAG: hypothetical protein LBC68_04420 [Prevotellaceae bacterium]|nr:hypothetical protein [Prevotellaceae bacterium]